MGDDTDNDLAGSGDNSETIKGGGGNDRLRGGEGDDTISGGQGNDQISGGDGDDKLRGGGDDDNLMGGDGNDLAQYEGDITDYDIFVDSQGRLRINDQVVDRDGNDTVRDVEMFNFNGTFYTLAEVLTF